MDDKAAGAPAEGGARAGLRLAVQLARGVWQDLRPVAALAGLLLATALALLAGPSLPPSLSGLKTIGPFVLLGLAVAIAIWFNRGMAFIAGASLLGACVAWSWVIDAPGGHPLAAQAVFLAVSLLVPVNFLLGLTLAERGFFHRQNYRWLLVAGVEILLVAWLASAGRGAVAGTGWLALLDHWLLRSPPMPVLARLLVTAAFAVALLRAWPRLPARVPLPLDLAMVSLLVAFFFGCEWARAPGAFSGFMSAAGAMLLLALLQESHRLAFRDELTGLPGRRALEERLRGLGDVYTIAMVDVDHFKPFNDTHGHDIGDQVLRLVAARLAEVEGGGVAFRYGGEEFAVLFPGVRLAAAEPHLERIRQSIQAYRMAVRAPDRPRSRKAGSARRGEQAPEKTLSVTVSLGVAEAAGGSSPSGVMKAADQALYRAKQAGRNRVSR